VIRNLLLLSMLLTQVCEAGMAQDPSITSFENSLNAGRYADLQVPLENYVQAHPDSWQALYQLGYVYFRQHNHLSSIRMLSRSLQLNADNAEAHRVLGFELLSISKSELAEHEFLESIRLKPDSAESHYALGRIYYETGVYKDAVTELEKAVALDPGYVKAYHNLGLAYDAVEQIEPAVRSFEKAIELNAKQEKPSEWPFINYAFFCNRRERFDQAIQLATKAIALNPDSEYAHVEAAHAWRGLGRPTNYIQELQLASHLNPNQPSYFWELAQAYHRLNKTEEFEAAMRQYTLLKSRERTAEASIALDR
jgi:tetratricopeptide (TPR) repeat protein